MTKKELRAAMRRRNLGMDAAERAEASRRIFGRAGRLEAFGAARTVGVFCSLPDEPDTAETLARWSAVKRIVVPRVEGDVMRFCEYDPQTLRPGAFGIAEPDVLNTTTGNFVCQVNFRKKPTGDYALSRVARRSLIFPMLSSLITCSILQASSSATSGLTPSTSTK